MLKDSLDADGHLTCEKSLKQPGRQGFPVMTTKRLVRLYHHQGSRLTFSQDYIFENLTLRPPCHTVMTQDKT